MSNLSPLQSLINHADDSCLAAIFDLLSEKNPDPSTPLDAGG